MTSKYHKEIVKLLHSMDNKHNRYTNFCAFIEVSCIAIANRFYIETELGKTMEAEYMNIIARYDKKDQEILSKMLALVVLALDEQPHDCLGEVFMQGELGSKELGQFFTPFTISEFMAQLNLSEVLNSDSMKQKGWFSLSEPTCGSGGMVIAAHKVIKAQGLDSATTFWCEARDISTNGFWMTYIQLSLLNIPARVVLGNTLAMEERRVLYTPAFLMNGWFEKIKQAEETGLEPINTPQWEPEQLEIFANGTLF